MKKLSKLFSILSIVTLIIQLAVNNYISQETAAILLIIGVGLQLLCENFTKLVISVTGFLLFVWTLSNGSLHDFKSILITFIPLFIGLFGLYTMLKPLFNILHSNEYNRK